MWTLHLQIFFAGYPLCRNWSYFSDYFIWPSLYNTFQQTAIRSTSSQGSSLACLYLCNSLLFYLYTCWPLPRSRCTPPLERQRLLGGSHVSLMWAVSVMAIQQQHKKPSLSLDPRMRCVALGQSTNNCKLCSAEIIGQTQSKRHDSPVHMMTKSHTLQYKPQQRQTGSIRPEKVILNTNYCDVGQWCRTGYRQQSRERCCKNLRVNLMANFLK